MRHLWIDTEDLTRIALAVIQIADQCLSTGQILVDRGPFRRDLDAAFLYKLFRVSSSGVPRCESTKFATKTSSSIRKRN